MLDGPGPEPGRAGRKGSRDCSSVARAGKSREEAFVWGGAAPGSLSPARTSRLRAGPSAAPAVRWGLRAAPPGVAGRRAPPLRRRPFVPSEHRPAGLPAERARRRRPGPRVAPSARPGNASGRPLSAVTAAGLRTPSSLLPPPPRPAPGAGGTGRAGSGRAGGWSRRRAIPREDHDLRAALLPPDGFAFSSRFLENTFLPTGLSKARR